MFSCERWHRILRSVVTCGLASLFILGAYGCNGLPAPDIVTDLIDISTVPAPPRELVQLREVAPPPVIQELHPVLDRYQPQVKILQPQPNQILQETTVAVQFEVNNYPLFKDPDLGLGSHLHVFLDDQPYTAIYNLEEPFILENLSPGTHTIRAFASRPWHESFKNEGAYDQVSFHVYTPTGKNVPDPKLPLLTYSRPEGSYGAEPIMLDFYLTNAPLHFLAQEDVTDDIQDWQIRWTINGESFLMNTWEPIYLEGWQPGTNWIKLELLGEDGEPLSRVLNTSTRLISYTPGGEDTLSKLVRGELSADEARGIVGGLYPLEETVEAIEDEIAKEEEVSENEIAEEEVSEEEVAEEEVAEEGTTQAEEPTQAEFVEEPESVQVEASSDQPEFVEEPEFVDQPEFVEEPVSVQVQEFSDQAEIVQEQEPASTEESTQVEEPTQEEFSQEQEAVQVEESPDQAAFVEEPEAVQTEEFSDQPEFVEEEPVQVEELSDPAAFVEEQALVQIEEFSDQPKFVEEQEVEEQEPVQTEELLSDPVAFVEEPEFVQVEEFSDQLEFVEEQEPVQVEDPIQAAFVEEREPVQVEEASFDQGELAPA